MPAKPAFRWNGFSVPWMPAGAGIGPTRIDSAKGELDIVRARRILVRAGFEKLGLHDASLADEMADSFSRERELAVQPFDGAVEALELLQSGGAQMALLTNGEARLQRAKLERFGLERFFRAILIEGETGVGKPDPRAHRAALAALGAAPEESWMVGDDLEFDVRPAKALGMRAAWIRNSAGGGESPADVVVASIRILVERWKSSDKKKSKNFVKARETDGHRATGREN